MHTLIFFRGQEEISAKTDSCVTNTAPNTALKDDLLRPNLGVNLFYELMQKGWQVAKSHHHSQASTKLVIQSPILFTWVKSHHFCQGVKMNWSLNLFNTGFTALLMSAKLLACERSDVMTRWHLTTRMWLHSGMQQRSLQILPKICSTRWNFKTAF